MEGEICKTLRVTFSVDEVLLLKEVFADEEIIAIAENKYGAAWRRAVQDLRNILANA